MAENVNGNITDAEISMVLDTYMYTNYEYARDGETLSEIVNEMPSHIDVGDEYYKEYTILKAACDDPRIGELTINYQSRKMGYNEGTNACTFMSRDRSDIYISFRGTADGEWADNGRGLTEKETKQQREAVRYFDEVMGKENIRPWQHVITTGHSKGANKVQFITMESSMAYLIDECYAVDGQGFSEKAVKNWKEKYSREEYDTRVSKIYGINGQNDFVSVLGASIILPSHIAYIETPADKKDFAAYHDITRMFAKGKKDENGNYVLSYTGRRNGYALDKGEVSRAAGSISDEVMKLPSFIRDGCCASLMQMVECINGGKVKGVNNEIIKPIDLKEFKDFGISTIIYSLFCKEDGLSFFKSLLFKEEFSKGIGTDDRVRVNYKALFTLADILRTLSVKIKTLIARVEAEGLLLPLTVDGVIIRKEKLIARVNRLYILQGKLIILSGLIESAGKLYEGFDKEALS